MAGVWSTTEINVHTDKFFWAHDIYKTGQNVWVSVNIFHDFLVDLAIKK